MRHGLQFLFAVVFYNSSQTFRQLVILHTLRHWYTYFIFTGFVNSSIDIHFQLDPIQTKEAVWIFLWRFWNTFRYCNAFSVFFVIFSVAWLRFCTYFWCIYFEVNTLDSFCCSHVLSVIFLKLLSFGNF